jgi:transposase
MDVSTYRDARSLDHETLEELRRLAVARVLQGETQVQVARSLQVRATTVWKWVDAYKRLGAEALASTKAMGPKPKLSAKQLEELRVIIVGKNPLQLAFGTALWSLPIVAVVIEREFGIILHESTVSRLLRRIGLTPQKPQRRAFQRDDAECAHWVATDFPRIVRAARRKQATILFGDETGVREDGTVGTTWGRKGQRPTVQVTFGRKAVNVISFISPHGRMWFRCYEGTLNAQLYIEYLAALLAELKGFIFLIVDKHPAHVAAATKRFLAEHKHRISVHHLPSYAPDMNPDEHVWGYLKNMFRRVPLDAGETLTTSVASSMKTIADDAELVRAFFRHPEVQYVADALKW